SVVTRPLPGPASLPYTTLFRSGWCAATASRASIASIIRRGGTGKERTDDDQDQGQRRQRQDGLEEGQLFRQPRFRQGRENGEGKIGRASCREEEEHAVVGVAVD